MDEITKAKLKQLKEYYYENDFSMKWIESVEKNIRQLVAMEDLAKNSSIQAIVNDARSRINTVNQLLSIDEDLTTDDRKKLFAEKKVHQFYLDRFEGRSIEKRFDRINSILDEEIKRTEEK